MGGFAPNGPSAKKIAIVKAGWHAEIGHAFAQSCVNHLETEGLTVTEYEVPDVVEIPLFTQKLIATGTVDMVIVTGLIVDHGVYRHDFVAATVLDATMKIQLDSGTPIIYGILTPQDFMSDGRETFFRSHFVQKGIEAANACLVTIRNEQLIAGLHGAAEQLATSN